MAIEWSGLDAARIMDRSMRLRIRGYLVGNASALRISPTSGQ